MRNAILGKSLNGCLLLYSLLLTINVTAQKKSAASKAAQCGTMARLDLKLKKDPTLKADFEQRRAAFIETVQKQIAAKAKPLGISERDIYSIPVVFHIVLTNPARVTDAQIMAQLDTLNKDYFGTNGDAQKLPSYFNNLFGTSGIQFCLAQRTPEGDETTGIDRITTSKTSFSNLDDAVKHASSGGTASWDPNKYFNIWICALSDDILGYATFPNDGSDDDQGVVIDYRSLPGGSYGNYNEGKTLTHETGHYFNLYHIWGDDDGACSGSDDVDDTPNQANSTSGCYTGIKTDNCTPTGNGILYQNYMDYSYDNCLVMFTVQQVTRMETALSTYRSSLLNSDGCVPVPSTENNAALRAITSPGKRICDESFNPVITIKNKGNQTLTSLSIYTKVDNNAPTLYQWTGSLIKDGLTSVTLGNVSVSNGVHNVVIYSVLPNNMQDEEVVNDTLSSSFEYYAAIDNVAEGFESSSFPPQGWDIVNPDNSITWKRVTGVGKTGNASMMMDNFNNETIGEQDYIKLPTIDLAGIDSAYLSFQVAAAAYTVTSTSGNNWDTLEVLLSKDCGVSYVSLYKKWGSTLVTRKTTTTDAFVPTASEWRKDSVNLTAYINTGNVLLAFRNTNGYENNIYIDDVNLSKQTINPNLKRQGFMVTPNPTTGQIAVQFYPNPSNLRGIEIFNAAGQRIAMQSIAANPLTYYTFNIGNHATGVYFIKAVFTDQVITKRILKN